MPERNPLIFAFPYNSLIELGITDQYEKEAYRAHAMFPEARRITSIEGGNGCFVIQIVLDNKVIHYGITAAGK